MLYRKRFINEENTVKICIRLHFLSMNNEITDSLYLQIKVKSLFVMFKSLLNKEGRRVPCCEKEINK